jgi:alkylation response protein AidB-like acyl-CoA dehydrogenase
MDARTVLANVREVSARFAAERRERQQRRALVAADFAQLREAGFPLAGVPVDHGGIWESVRRSTRPVCELLRTLAHGDSSVALVCAMHPTVLVFWMATPQVPAPFQAAWDAQRRRIFQPVREGAWWGTVSFEPGSGGDLAKTQAVARPGPMDGVYRLSGQKSFRCRRTQGPGHHGRGRAWTAISDQVKAREKMSSSSIAPTNGRS